MADLEEKILKKNVPGRYSNWQDDDDNRHEDSDNDHNAPNEGGDEVGFEQSLLEQQRDLAAEGVPEPIRQQIAAKRLGEAKTGVKGVLADYREAKAMEFAIAQQEKLERERLLTRMAEGYKFPAQQDEDNKEDDFMHEYRMKRLAELRQSSNLPVFGEVLEASAFGFVDEVDNTDPRVCVCVHLYENNVPECVKLNKQLIEVAKRRPHVKFMRVKASNVTNQDIVIDGIALPMLMIYRAGATLHVIPRVQDELEDFGDDVEWLLETHDVFEQPTASEESVVATIDTATAPRVMTQRLAAADFSDGDDSDISVG